MTATFHLLRHRDVSNVSGTGVVAEGAEFSDGAVAVHWFGPRPSTAVWADIRDVEAIHGHQGATEIVLDEDPNRLLAAYERVIPFLLEGYGARPLTAQPHPDHPDRLRLTFPNERVWRFWIALLDGSTDAATHDEVDGEIRHTWITPDGNVWLQYFSSKNDYPDSNPYDDRD